MFIFIWFYYSFSCFWLRRKGFFELDGDDGDDGEDDDKHAMDSFHKNRISYLAHNYSVILCLSPRLFRLLNPTFSAWVKYFLNKSKVKNKLWPNAQILKNCAMTRRRNSACNSRNCYDFKVIIDNLWVTRRFYLNLNFIHDHLDVLLLTHSTKVDICTIFML